jgi:hypothetical protein
VVLVSAWSCQVLGLRRLGEGLEEAPPVLVLAGLVLPTEPLGEDPGVEVVLLGKGVGEERVDPASVVLAMRRGLGLPEEPQHLVGLELDAGEGLVLRLGEDVLAGRVHLRVHLGLQVGEDVGVRGGEGEGRQGGGEEACPDHDEAFVSGERPTSRIELRAVSQAPGLPGGLALDNSGAELGVKGLRVPIDDWPRLPRLPGTRMTLPARRRAGLGTLGVLGIVGLLVVGVMAFSAFRTLGEFFGTSGSSSGGRHERPPRPAAPAAPSTADGTGDLAALNATVRELEQELARAAEAGDGARAAEVRAELDAARRRFQAAVAAAR